jgi:hypothetical protein
MDESYEHPEPGRDWIAEDAYQDMLAQLYDKAHLQGDAGGVAITHDLF